MAIIYTYPRLSNPDGTELIVVSETKNQNATRLLSVGDICSFCSTPPGSGGCNNSFLTVQTTSFFPAEANGCDDGLIFTSGDGSIDITNVGNTINFAIGSGGTPEGGACPDTYIIKPVTCAGDTCVTSIIESEWIYTCDEGLGALAPGYINNLTITGVSIDSPSGCWYIEQMWATADTTTCCCTTPSTDYKLLPCYPGTTYWTTEALTPTISTLIGQVIIATTAEGNHCYTVSEEVAVDPVVAVVIGFPQEDCNTPECINLENMLLTPCPGNDESHNTNIVTNWEESLTIISIDSGQMISIDPAPGVGPACYVLTKPSVLPLVGGPVTLDLEYTEPTCECCTSTLKQYVECDDPAGIHIFDIDGIFSNNAPPPCVKAEFVTEEFTCLTFVSCVTEGEVTVPLTLVECDPDCSDPDCESPSSTIRYIQCDVEGGDPPGVMDTYVYFTDTGSMPTHIIVTFDDGFGIITNWCYEQDLLDSQPENPLYSYVIKDPLGCIPCEIYEYYDCLDPATRLFTNNAAIMNIVAPMTFTTIEGSSTCYTSLGVVTLPEPGIIINETTLTQSFLDCECCASGVYPNVHEYTLCGDYDPAPPGAPATVNIDLTGHIPLGTHPNILSVDPGIGQFVCYEYVQPVCAPSTLFYNTEYEDCALCISSHTYYPMIEIQSCDGLSTQTVIVNDFVPDISSATPGEVINVSTGPLSVIHTCWEIINMDTTGPATVSGINTFSFATETGGSLNECECCEQDLYQYDICTPNACAGAPAATLYIDANAVGFPPGLPTFITAETIATSDQCCYELVGSVVCDDPTGTYISTNEDCEPCND